MELYILTFYIVLYVGFIPERKKKKNEYDVE